MKVYLSPSNQYDNLYSYGGTNEMEQCNKIAAACEKYLLKSGVEVKRAPKGQNMYTSISESNAWGTGLHVCIHTNACLLYTSSPLGYTPFKAVRAPLRYLQRLSCFKGGIKLFFRGVLISPQ